MNAICVDTLRGFRLKHLVRPRMAKDRLLNGGLVSSYVVGHLCTFSLPKETKDIVTEADKRLAELEAKNRLWPENLVLKVDEFAIQLDAAEQQSSQQVVEKFPLSAVKSCKSKPLSIEKIRRVSKRGCFRITR